MAKLLFLPYPCGGLFLRLKSSKTPSMTSSATSSTSISCLRFAAAANVLKRKSSYIRYNSISLETWNESMCGGGEFWTNKQRQTYAFFSSSVLSQSLLSADACGFFVIGLAARFGTLYVKLVSWWFFHWNQMNSTSAIWLWCLYLTNSVTDPVCSTENRKSKNINRKSEKRAITTENKAPSCVGNAT